MIADFGRSKGRAGTDGPNPAHKSLVGNTGLIHAPRWWRTYATRTLITDAVAVYIAVLVAYLVRIDGSGITEVTGALSPDYLFVSIAIMWGWMAALVVGRTQDRRLVGAGPLEYQRVFSVTWRLFASIAVVAYLFRMDIARGYLAIAFPLGLSLVLLGRLCWRQWLIKRRENGHLLSTVLVMGHRLKAAALAREMRTNATAGFVAIGICVPSNEVDEGSIEGADILGTMEDAPQLARDHGVDVVTVVGSDNMTEQAMRDVAWALEGTGIDLALAIPLRDVSAPRVIMQPLNGLPLVYVQEPRFTGPKYVLKTLVDWMLAFAITLILLPLLLTIAVSVKTTSKGAVLYRQERVGVRGKTFTMFKFRSMYIDAEERLAELRHLNEGNSVLFKMRNDPRVTKIGRILRRFSLDELPQLLNVLRGEMSLVGPRPPLPKEVVLYEGHVHRRLLVKPGITGLWQVSGRSDLSWDESVRLDVYYAENWTVFGDILILVRTAKAVISRRGAY